LGILERGVGRTVVLPPIIHDFCLCPPKTVFKAAFDDTISRSESTALVRSLSGGLRMIYVGIRVHIGFELVACKSDLQKSAMTESEVHRIFAHTIRLETTTTRRRRRRRRGEIK
jgi:hypothetical protein